MGALTGHCDLIARYGKRWVAYEFKTTGPKPEKPKRNHQLQVRSYSAMMKKQFGIEITAYTIIYVGRQFLERWKFGPYDASGSLAQTERWIRRSVRGFKAATRARRDPSHQNLVDVIRERPCKSREDWDEYMSRSQQFTKGPCPLLSKCTAGDKTCLKAVEEMIHG